MVLGLGKKGREKIEKGGTLAALGRAALTLVKASRPLIRVLVFNDNHYGLTFLFEL
jgi:hypothetical protein